MYLFFDTETTGLPKKWNEPVTNLDNWPRLVQLAWVLCDEEGNVVDEKDRIIVPEGFEIPVEASNIHRITTERAHAEGIELNNALNEFAEVMKKSHYLVAHNMNFDEKIAGAEFLRKAVVSDVFDIAKLCTMKSSTDYCRIPGAYGNKWPTLSELHIHLFDEDFDGAHDALVDVRACARSFFELKNRGVM